MYVLSGMRDELTKVDRLADYEHLKAKVRLLAMNDTRDRQLITPLEQAVLTTTIKEGTGKAGHPARPEHRPAHIPDAQACRRRLVADHQAWGAAIQHWVQPQHAAARGGARVDGRGVHTCGTCCTTCGND